MQGSINSSSMFFQEKEDDGSNSNHTITVKVSFASQEFDLHVPAVSTFGEVKSVISQTIGLEPKVQKLLFRGKEKEDHEHLHLAGVKDNSKLLVMEDKPVEEIKPEVARVATEISRGAEAVAEVRAEVDKLSEQVYAIQSAVIGGSTVEDKNIMFITEMLMRMLLKLDGIEAEGEGRVQRKMEVRRVQSLVETMDVVKARNSNPFQNNGNAVTVTTQWETFDSGVGSLNPPPPRPSSTVVTESGVGSLNPPPPRPSSTVVTESGVGSLNPPPPRPSSTVATELGVGSLNPPPPRPSSTVVSELGVGSLNPPPPRPSSTVATESGVGSLNPPPPRPSSTVVAESGVGSLNPPPPRPSSTVVTEDWEQFE